MTQSLKRLPVDRRSDLLDRAIGKIPNDWDRQREYFEIINLK